MKEALWYKLYNKLKAHENIMIVALIATWLLGNLIFFCTFDLSILGHKLFTVTIARVTMFLVALFATTKVLIETFIEKKNIQQYSFEIKAFFLLYVVWLIWGTVAVFFVSDKMAGAKEIVDIIHNICIIFSLVILINTRERLELALKVLKFCALVIAGIFVIQLFSGYIFPFSRYTFNDMVALFRDKQDTIVPTTLFTNENDMCTYITLIFTFYFADFIGCKIGKNSYILFLKMLSLLFVITISNATIARYSLYVMLTFFVVCTVLLRRKITIKNHLIKTTITYGSLFFSFGPFFDKSSIAFIIAKKIREIGHFIQKAILSFLLSIHWISADVLSKFNADYNPIFVNKVDSIGQQINSTIDIRINLIKGGVSMLFKSYLLGVGPSAYKDHIDKNTTRNIINPHNFWIELASQYGILIAGSFIFLYVKMWLKLFKLYRERTTSLELGMVLASIVFVFVSIMSSSALGLYTLWIVFGVLLSAGGALKEAPQPVLE